MKTIDERIKLTLEEIMKDINDCGERTEENSRWLDILIKDERLLQNALKELNRQLNKRCCGRV